MKITDIAFGITDWAQIPKTAHPGETGTASWQTKEFGAIRVRVILLCLEGELETELEDGRRFTLKPGMSYQVADQAEAHRSSTSQGAKLFVVD